MQQIRSSIAPVKVHKTTDRICGWENVKVQIESVDSTGVSSAIKWTGYGWRICRLHNWMSFLYYLLQSRFKDAGDERIEKLTTAVMNMFLTLRNLGWDLLKSLWAEGLFVKQCEAVLFSEAVFHLSIIWKRMFQYRVLKSYSGHYCTLGVILCLIFNYRLTNKCKSFSVEHVFYPCVCL